MPPERETRLPPATGALVGRIPNAALEWSRADPATAFVIVPHGLREGLHALREEALR